MVRKSEKEQVDGRPESSPYVNPEITLYFGDGLPLRVCSALLDKHPKLSSFCECDTTLHLEHISGNAGHVLVHYLFTGTYQCLRPKGFSLAEKQRDEFTTSLRVFSMARDYEMPILEELAQGEIERLGNGLPVPWILDKLKDACLHSRVDNTWLQSYLRALVEPLMDDATFLGEADPNGYGETISFPNVLFKVIIDLHREKTDLLRTGMTLETKPICNSVPEPTTAAESAEDTGQKSLPDEPYCEPGPGSTVAQECGGKAGIDEAGLPIISEQDMLISERRTEPLPSCRTSEAGDMSAVELGTQKKKKMKKMKKKQKARRELSPEVEQVEEDFPDVTPSASGVGPSRSVALLDTSWGSSFGGPPKGASQIPLFGGNNNAVPHIQTAKGNWWRSDNQSSHGNPNGSEPKPANSDLMINVPLTRGAEQYHNVYSGLFSLTERIQNICAQRKFENFSPEELRWKDQLCMGDVGQSCS